MKTSIQEILHAAYSFVRSTELNKSISSITLDHLIQDHIEAIQGGESRGLLDATGKRTNLRPTKLDRLDRLEQDIDSVVKAVEEAGDDPQKLTALGLRVIPEESI